MTDIPNAIEISGLSKSFGETTAVNDIYINIPPGTTLGLLGPNGAGKSSTLKMLMGMLRPTHGSIHVFGHDLATQAPTIKQRIGYVPESNQIYRWMTITQALRFSRAMYQSWNDQHAANLLDLFQLPSHRRVRNLSKGMLAKLSLLIALAHEPDLLILDEPLSGLDPIVRDDFLDGVMQDICHNDRTVIFSSHLLDEVSRLADSIAIMNAGQILVHSHTQHLLENARRIRAVLHDGRLPQSSPPNAIWQNINRREWLMTLYPFSDASLASIREQNPIHTLDVSPLSLDDLFRDFIRGQARC